MDADKLLSLITKYEETFLKVDELDLVIIRGQLYIEEFLVQIVSDFLFHPDYILQADLTFFQKTQLARSMSLDEQSNTMWDLILEVNSLRNKIAHELPNSKKIAIKLDKVKNLYNTEAPKNRLWEADNLLGMKFAVMLCVGFLTTFSEEIIRFKKAIHEMDKIYNPHRHK